MYKKKKSFLLLFLNKVGLLYLEYYVELKYLLKCMLCTVLTLINENYFQILIVKSFLQIVFHFFNAAVSHTELFWQIQVDPLQKAFYICKKQQTICRLVEALIWRNVAVGQQLIQPLSCWPYYGIV